MQPLKKSATVSTEHALQQYKRPWHTLDLPNLLRTLSTTEDGLSEDDAKARLREFGPNELPHKPPPPVWQILLNQIRNPLIQRPFNAKLQRCKDAKKNERVTV